jgi:hypothetical protein
MNAEYQGEPLIKGTSTMNSFLSFLGEIVLLSFFFNLSYILWIALNLSSGVLFFVSFFSLGLHGVHEPFVGLKE